MQEDLLQYIWKHSLFKNREYLSDTNEKIQVLDPGTHNHNSGPDFLNARIRIDGITWVGNVELHVTSSDWGSHKHNSDPAYDNVILHVAQNINTACYNTKNRRIPCISLIPNEKIIRNYYRLMDNDAPPRCGDALDKLDRSLISFWLSSLTIERLRDKTNGIKDLLKITQNSWEESFYIAISKSFGLKLNALPFEMLARTTPLKLITKAGSNLFQIEALLFGQAGFLENGGTDDYHNALKKEYDYLKKKYKLEGIQKYLWKFLRLRPLNFPTVRIAELSSLLFRSRNLFSKTLSCDNPEQIYALYHSTASDYWTNHYTFESLSTPRIKSPGKKTIDSIIINTIVPFIFVYGESKNNELYKTQAINLLEQITRENNKIIKIWNKLDVKCRHAADSQALLQLTNRYCREKRCLDCQIGNLILK